MKKYRLSRKQSFARRVKNKFYFHRKNWPRSIEYVIPRGYVFFHQAGFKPMNFKCVGSLRIESNSQGKRRRSRPLDRRVRPEGQKGAPSLEDGRSPRKTAGPRKRRSAARRIAGGACCTSAGGQKGLKAFGTGPTAGISGCAHEAGDGTNGQGKPPAECGSA